MNFYRIKDELAFKAIKGKKVRIIGAIPNTTDGVYVQCADLWDRDLGSIRYKFRRQDLEPWT